MQITKDKMVKIHYTLKDSDGVLIDSSAGQEPFEYLHGNGKLIPGLEAELENKKIGDKFKATIEPRNAYGEYDENMIVEVPRNQFDENAEIEIGMKFEAQTAGGPMLVTIKKITDDTVTVDGNHELAGKTLIFDIEVVDIRDATQEELTPPTTSCVSCHSSRCSGCNCGDCHSN